MLLCSVPILCRAENSSPSRADKYASYFYNTLPSKESAANVAKTGAVAVGTNLAAETQAVFLMAALAAAKGAGQQYEIAGIKKQDVSLKDVAVAATQSAEQIVSSSEIAGGIGGMFITNKAAKVPLEAWTALVMNSTAKPLLKEVVAGFSANLVGMVGFDAFDELTARAVQMIPNEEDRLKAQRLLPTLWSAMTSGSKTQSAEDKRICTAVFSNMYEILVKDSDLREKWWSFVVRNRLQTGNFAATVSMMSAGATLGNRLTGCIPNPITKVLSPFVGGAIGAALGATVNQPAKDSVTEHFAAARVGLYNAKIKTSHVNLRAAVRGLESDHGIDWKQESTFRQIDEEFKTIETFREDMMTSFYDKTHLLNSRLYELGNKIQLAKEHQNPEAEQKLRTEFNQYLKKYKESKLDIDTNLSTEIASLQSLSKHKGHPATEKLIQEKIEELQTTKKWTDRFLDQLQATSTWGQTLPPKVPTSKEAGLMTEQDNQRLLEKIYMWGYKQKPFNETLDFNN